MKKFTIVDAHHHLWDLQAVHYPWLMERGVVRFFGDPAPIQKDYRVSEFKSDIGELPVTQSVHIQVGAAADHSLRETRWLQSAADQSGGLPNAIVAFCDLSAEDAQAQLDAQGVYANLRGIRQIVGRSEAEDAVTGSGALLDDPNWRRNLASLSQRGLSFDLQLIPPQLPRAIEVLGDCPDLAVALCHCGSPWDRSPEGLAFWKKQIAALAELPTVHCKLSGFGMFDHDWNVTRVRDIALHVIDCFGPDRCMFGSNFPVDKLYRDYQTVFANYFELVRDFTESEQRTMLGGTAQRFYRI
ncbi:MAG: amidohydrolase family protein [Xanthomonadales bacterium]|nr:amidohydrolase family protein [Xanthomonadales bacterium]